MFSERSRSFRVALIAGLAGGATLAGETLGARLLRPLVGSTAIAQAAVVAGVLGGIGIGAVWTGRRLARAPDLAHAVLERALLALAALTVMAPWFARGLSHALPRGLIALAETSPRAADLTRTLVALMLTLPYGALAGASYPALAAVHGHGAGRATAITGAASSIGASAAVLCVTFVIAPAFGLRGGLLVATLLYAVAWLIAKSFPRVDAVASRAPAEPRESAPRADARDANHVLVALAITGVATSAWQLGFTRFAVLSFGPSAFALAATTAAYTLSFGLGEAATATRVETVRRPGVALVATLAGSAVCAMAATALAGELPAWSAARFGCSPPTMTTLWAAAFGMLVTFMLPVVGLAAVALPLGVRVLADSGHTRPAANARCLGAMAVGNVAGALAAPLLLLPSTTLAIVLRLAGFALALAAAVVAWRVARDSIRVAVIALGLAALGLAALASERAWPAAAWDRTSLSSGPFLYAQADQRKLGEIIRVHHGREATVAVRRNRLGGYLLQIDGKIDATSGGNTATQVLVGIVPAVLAARPREVLVIGLGSGMTVDAVRDVPGVAHVDVTELLPEVITVARTDFAVANHGVLAAPNVRTLEQDASLYLRGTRARYDVIVSEPSNPWVTGMADLFTVEALTAARERLNSGGAMSAWLHAYSSDAETFAAIVATFREVFPRCALVEMTTGQDYMLVGFVEPVSVDVDLALTRIADARVAVHLARAGIGDRDAFFGAFIAGAPGVQAMTRDAHALHADDLRLEFRAPRLLYTEASAAIYALFARSHDSPLAGLAPRGLAYASIVDTSAPWRIAALQRRQVPVTQMARDCR